MIPETLKALLDLDPRYLTTINTIVLAWVVFALTRLQREFWGRVNAGDILMTKSQADARARDDRVTDLAKDHGALDQKLEAIHRRLDEQNTQLISLNTEVRVRLQVLDQKIGIATGIR